MFLCVSSLSVTTKLELIIYSPERHSSRFIIFRIPFVIAKKPPSWNLFLRELISHDVLNFWTLSCIFKSFNYCKILWKRSFIEFWTEKELKISTKIYKKKVFYVFKFWLRGKNRPSKSPSFAGRVSLSRPW